MTGFATVELVVHGSAVGPARVRWSVAPDDLSSVQPAMFPVEIEAALRGVREALDVLGRPSGDAVDGLVLGVTKLEINEVDTTPAAVRAVAAAATADLFGLSDRVEVVHDGSWQCLWHIG